ncbi:MAG: UDPglucose 6-dehydrogenase [Candidatus Omnitrophota bacterium]
MKIAVIGTGYVGLVTAACFADLGHDVIGVDNDAKKVAILKQGRCHFFEPGLEELVATQVKQNRLSFTTEIQMAAKKSDVIFIAVGTPPRPDGGADLSQIEAVAKSVAKALGKSAKLIIEKSTVPVRTGVKIKQTLKAYAPKGANFDVASNPEFLREGTAIHDFMNPDRIVVGADSARARTVLKQLYGSINGELVLTDLNSAEIIKHASNSFLAMKISFTNAISRVCELAGADVEEVAYGMGLDSRIGPKFLNAGIGFGGFCFPKDVSAFIHISDSLGYDFKLLRAVEEINNDQWMHFIKKIEDKLWNINDKTIGVWGLSFKPNTDDMRFAPSIQILNYLKKHGAKLRVYDPKAMDNARESLKGVTFAKNQYDVCIKADCLLILTEWNHFKEADMQRVKKLMKQPIMVDGRNLYNPQQMKKLGFDYISMGR